MASTEPLENLDPDSIQREYFDRGLDDWSDDRLISAVASVIAVARQDRADSFILHAPLELIARRRLLQMVAPSARLAARLHITAIAANYEAFGPPAARASGLEAGWGSEPTSTDGLDLLIASIAGGDLDGVDRAAAMLAATSVDPVHLVRTLAPAVLTRTSAAGHAPIFLQFLLNAGRDGRALQPMLRPLARELARQPDWKIGWVDEARSGSRAAGGDPADLYDVLATAPRLGLPGSSFIHPLMTQVDTEPVATALLRPIVDGLERADSVVDGDRRDAAARIPLRVAAQSMLHDTADEAPYGWTHCLTMPQAVLAIDRSSRGVAVAATQVLGFRCGLSANDLPDLVLEGISQAMAPEVSERVAALATAAAIRHDAHIVKYALAVIDAAAEDPDAADLFLSAGERLLEIWDTNGGDAKDRFWED